MKTIVNSMLKNTVTKKLPLIIATALTLSIGGLANAEVADDPLLAKFMIDEFEKDVRGGGTETWSAQAWLGYDLDKLWIKTEGEREDGATESSELQALYSRAIAPFWDLQVGVRKDFLPADSREWGVIGVQGLAPYYFETDVAFFIGDGGDTALRLEAEYELLITQKLILTPEIEANFYGQNDELRGVGSGLSDVELGLRLRYEFTREISSYVGVSYAKNFGNSADFARAEGQDSSETQVVVGFRVWF